MANKAKKTPAGTWRVRVYDYTDAAGRQHVRSFTAPTKAARKKRPEACSRRVVFSPHSGPRGVLKGGEI